MGDGVEQRAPVHAGQPRQVAHLVPVIPSRHGYPTAPSRGRTTSPLLVPNPVDDTRAAASWLAQTERVNPDRSAATVRQRLEQGPSLPLPIAAMGTVGKGRQSLAGRLVATEPHQTDRPVVLRLEGKAAGRRVA